MTVEAQFLLALYSIIVTVGLIAAVYALIDAKRTINMVGLAAKAKKDAACFEESVRKTMAEADAIVLKAKTKTQTEPKTRAATQKAVAKGRAVTQRKVVNPK